MPRRIVNVRKKIREALTDKPLTWSELLTRADVSSGALSKHLNWLIHRQVVKTRTEGSRPPSTVYYLAEKPFANLVFYLTEGMTDQQADYFLQEILTQTTFDVVFESYSKIMDLVLSEPTRSFPPHPTLGDFLSIRSWEELEVQLGQNLKKFREEMQRDAESPMSMMVTDLANINRENLGRDEQAGVIEKEFSPITVQFILTIYQMERWLLLSAFPKELSELIMEKADLRNTLVLHHIQKHNAWKEFDSLFQWWHKEVTPNLPSVMFIVRLALGFWFNHIVTLKQTSSNNKKV